MYDLFQDAQWDELYAFFASGNPPLMVQLLGLNTVVFIVFIIRRMRGARTMRADTASTIQSLLLAANMLAIFQENIRRSINWIF